MERIDAELVQPCAASEALPAEEWRPVAWYEGRYSVSSLGRVRTNIPRAGLSEKILRTFPNRKGYLTVSLHADGAGHTIAVHSLVAAAFLGPKPAGFDVNHISAVRTDNRAVNLEYVTRLENILHAKRLGRLATGDRNGSRLHPERLARGERHGSKTCPEAFRARRALDDGRTFRGAHPDCVTEAVQRG